MKILLSNPVESVTIAESAGVGTLSFSSIKANSLGIGALKSIAEGISMLSKSASVRSIVVKSAGDSTFCAGASFQELQAAENIEEVKEIFLGFAKIGLAIRNAEQLVIGQIQGKCVGGGVGLVAACDYAIASKTAAFRLSEFENGIGPFVIAALVERKIGTAAFAACTIDTQWRDSHWALQNNLISKVMESGQELESVVENMANELAGRSIAATKELKQLFWAGTDQLESLLRQRAEKVAQLYFSLRNPT